MHSCFGLSSGIPQCLLSPVLFAYLLSDILSCLASSFLSDGPFLLDTCSFNRFMHVLGIPQGFPLIQALLTKSLSPLDTSLVYIDPCIVLYTPAFSNNSLSSLYCIVSQDPCKPHPNLIILNHLTSLISKWVADIE